MAESFLFRNRKVNLKVVKFNFGFRSSNLWTFNLIKFHHSPSATTASSCSCIHTSGWTSSATTATQLLARTASRRTRTSSSSWTTATPTNLSSSSSSGPHDMRPRWTLQNPRHRQKSEAAMSPVICRWRTESLTWQEASRAPSGATSRCGTYRTVPTRRRRCKLPTAACAAAMARTPCGSRPNLHRFWPRRSTTISTRSGAARRSRMMLTRNRSVPFGTFPQHRHPC